MHEEGMVFSKEKYMKYSGYTHLKKEHWANRCDGLPVKDGIISGTLFASFPNWEVKIKWK